MLQSTPTAGPSLSTSSSSIRTSSPTKSGRLRGLNYFRSYTHLHGSRTPLNRSHTSPAGTSPQASPSATRGQRGNPAPSPQRSNSSLGNLSGWAPTVGGQSGITRTTAAPQESQHSTDGNTMRRTRGNTHGSGVALPEDGAITSEGGPNISTDEAEDIANPSPEKKSEPTLRLIPHHEARASRPSLTFPIVSRSLPAPNAIVRVGRYSERDNQAAVTEGNTNFVAPIGFKSKVVSRRHCEFWCSNNQWYIKDVKSSSGTFLNHVRLSPAGTESRPFPINDGDIVQLGIDFKGGEEVIFRCVKMRVECNRSWQKGLNRFNTQTHKRLRNLASASSGPKDSDTASVNSSECSICLNAVSPCQALFVAPCSHVWHYKCIRTLIYPAWPSFQCPNCRAYADLEADVEPAEVDSDVEIAQALRESEQAQGGGSSSDDGPGADGELQSSSTRQTLIPDRSAAAEDDGDDDDDDDDDADGDSDGTDLNRAMEGALLSSEPDQQERSDPVDVPGSSSSSRGRSTVAGTYPDGPRSATPTSTAQFALAAGVLSGADGPMTPRNDVGPFVLDHASVEGPSKGKAAVRWERDAEEGAER